MNRYQAMFERLTESQRIAFVPFAVLGYPNLETCERMIEVLIAAGADALELGIPFSDPLADGPTIQRAMSFALAGGVTPADCFALVAGIRRRFPELPLGLLVYANLVWVRRPQAFFEQCAQAGIDSVLVADIPIDEADAISQAAIDCGIQQVYLCPPNIDRRRLELIARRGQGYTYLLSRAGVTGAGVAAGQPVREIVEQLRELRAPPPILGFGISRPEHVRQAVEAGARGVICGSALVEMLQPLEVDARESAQPATTLSRIREDEPIVAAHLTDYLRPMVAATRLTENAD